MNDSSSVIVDYFRELSRIPRESGHEEQVRAWLEEWARKHGFTAKSDPAGNLVVRVPASAGNEGADPIVLQAHTDMVCEKRPDSTHDFSRDPIEPVVDGEWLRANGTTLGADNGIGVAMAMACATAPGVTHPPLELLFTVDEETGLTGASALKPGFFDGKVLINVDSEDEGVFTVGCAGGQNTLVTLPVQREQAGPGLVSVRLGIGGLKGGHSGTDIHKVHANANVLLLRLLDEILAAYTFRMESLSGGNAHNAIPRNARATVVCNPDVVKGILSTVEAFVATVRNEFRDAEPKLDATAEAIGETEPGLQVLTAEETRRAVSLLRLMPHGVVKMSPDIPGLVQTSTNFAAVELKQQGIEILTSQRSSTMSEIDATAAVVAAVGHVGHGSSRVEVRYPSWEPRMDTVLLGRSKDLYTELFAKDPVVEVIHAGLECGVISAVNPGMEMISIGPTIRGAHSPDERLHLPTVEKVWTFLSRLVASYAGAN